MEGFLFVKNTFLSYNLYMSENITDNLYKKIPAKNKIQEIYSRYTPVFQSIMENIKKRIQDNIKLTSQPTYKSRIKSFDSYYKKVLRQHPDEAVESEKLVCLTDMMGIRIICTFLEDITDVQEQIKSLFKVTEVEIKGASQSYKEFGYESVHVLVSVPSSCIPETLPENVQLPKELVCEIQIRTILQDAWAEVEHELIYKSEFTPFDMPLKRKLASMNASLSLADIIFQEIRDYQKKLQNEMMQRRLSFYEKADDLTIVDGEKTSGKEKNLERVNPYVRGTIDDMLLQAIHAHNTGDLKSAITIYTQIIESKPEPNNIVLSVILKHRGMAYFAENDFEKALSDFIKSYEFDKNSFRSAYYVGIVLSIKKDYAEAVKWFTISLEINGIQSHAFYRRAVSYFEMGEFEKSMNDVVAAEKLGLEDSGLETLHSKLMEKFDMKM